ncbi:MAG: hypothetical protein WDO15_10130 [Bacteroidota bacterium]
MPNGYGIMFEYDPVAHTITKKYDLQYLETVSKQWVATRMERSTA